MCLPVLIVVAMVCMRLSVTFCHVAWHDVSRMLYGFVFGSAGLVCVFVSLRHGLWYVV